ncbi:recombinase family protein [Desulfotomaculum defluvii]
MAAKSAKKVAVIPAKPIEVIQGLPENSKKKVCAYCRVSTDHREQESSYESQVTYYTAYIKNKPEWTFVDIYADEGISGTSTKNRDEFKRMIEDCMEGKIDIIITKSISRFARNTLDCLRFVRKLKDKGVAVFFEKENINSLDSKGEVLLTILSSLAQDESRNISENVKWGIACQFQNGKTIVNTTRFLGYDKDENGELIINEEEAKLVRRIYREYLEGKSYNAIAKGLTKDGIKTVTGGTKWWDSTITGILTNEKYYGDLLLQKTITVDFLDHKRVDNKGQAQQYLIEGNHEPIISKEIFDKVQDEKERRALLKGNLVGDRHKYSSKYSFSGKVICGDCGNIFKRRTWNSKSKYKKIVWQCKTYIVDGKEACDAKAVGEQVLMDAFVRVFNRINENKDDFIKTLTENIEKVLSGKSANKEMDALDNQIEIMKNDLKGLIKFQIRNNIDDGVYKEEYWKLSNELEELRRQKAKLEKENSNREDYRQRVNEIIEVLGKQELLTEFDDKIFNALVEKIEVLSPTHFVFVLKSGMRVEEV